MGNNIHGSATITFNSQYIETNDDAVLTPGGGKNTSRVIGKHAYNTQTYMGSKLECKIPYTGELSLTDLQSMRNVEIVFVSDTGKSWVIRNAAQTGDVSLSGGQDGGEVSLVFEGDAAEEMR